MSDFTFAPATKAQRKARIALAGPSGSGKTWTALILATTLGSKVAVVDTERGSASLYSDDFTFDALDLYTFSPEDLPKILAAAAAQGYDVVVIDSLSHFWMGAGGMLEQVDRVSSRSGGNSFAGWKAMRPAERAMIDALLAYPGHVIVTMRTKTEFVVEEDSRGKKVPRKIGLKPEQRDNIEYEFDVVGELDDENNLVITKTRCRALAGQIVRKPDADLGKTILGWLDSGTATTPLGDYVDRTVDPSLTYAAARALYDEVKARGLLGAAVMDEVGDPTSLGELILAKGLAAQSREQEAS